MVAGEQAAGRGMQQAHRAFRVARGMQQGGALPDGVWKVCVG